MPEGFGGQMPDMGNFDPSQMPDMGSFDPSQMPDMGNFDPSQMPDMGNFDPVQMPSFGGGGFGGMGAADVKLQYVDDNADSYTNIWNNAKTDITKADQNRLIQSLKKLSANEDIESVVDVEQVIRYFVVHNYVCNGDSYTGAMIHNYYLYEEDGRMAMIPWDYNLAFGTFQAGNAQSTVNTPIDAPVSGSSEDRPMWNWIVANEEYIEQYHQYYAEFMSTVDVESIIDNAYTLIKPYVEKDPTAFYSVEEFEKGVEAMRQFCTLRSESISMQLENGKTAKNMNYANASGLTLSDMVSMRMGGGMPDMQNRDSAENGNQPFGGNRENMQLPENAPSFEFAPSDKGNVKPGETMPGRDDMRPGRPNSTEPAAPDFTGWLWILASVLVLGAGILIAKMYKR